MNTSSRHIAQTVTRSFCSPLLQSLSWQITLLPRNTLYFVSNRSLDQMKWSIWNKLQCSVLTHDRNNDLKWYMKSLFPLVLTTTQFMQWYYIKCSSIAYTLPLCCCSWGAKMLLDPQLQQQSAFDLLLLWAIFVNLRGFYWLITEKNEDQRPVYYWSCLMPSDVLMCWLSSHAMGKSAESVEYSNKMALIKWYRPSINYFPNELVNT